MDRDRFEELVVKAVNSLPDELLDRLENVDVVVEERPNAGQLAEVNRARGETLLGLYEGVPLTNRSRHYGMVVPDKITIFQKPIEAMCANDTAIMAEIRQVVWHEIAHHFGISDNRLSQLEKDD